MLSAASRQATGTRRLSAAPTSNRVTSGAMVSTTTSTGVLYDMGCGWGGPALQLVRDLGCRVEGITASGSQFRWCNEQGLLVRHADMEATLPPGRFDVALMLESFDHVRDKRRLQRRLRPLARRLILREHCPDATPASMGIDGTMYLESSAALRQMLEDTGWSITAWANRRAASMPTIALWNERLRDVPPSDDRHLETLRAFCTRVAANADTWAQSHPLMEVIAD